MKSGSRQSIRRFICALVMLLVLPACSSSSEPAATSEPAAGATAVPEPSAPEPTASATPEPTAEPEPTATPDPTATPQPTPEPTATPKPTATPDPNPVDPALVGSRDGNRLLFPGSGNGGYDVSIYDLDFTVADDLTSFSAVATITASATQDLQRFSLDARDLVVDSVMVDQAPAAFTIDGPELVISVDEPMPTASEFVVEVVYEASPEFYRPIGIPFPMGWDVDAGQQLLIHGFPGAAATWAPINEDLGEPPARYIMTFDVPNGFTATASGTPIEGDDGEVIWDTGRPVFYTSFAIAKYETTVIDWQVPVEVSVQGEPLSPERFDRILEILTFVEELFGPFPFDRLGISEIRSRPFSYSAPMRILLNNRFDDGLLAHEISHQWAGNAVTNSDEGSSWLYEGLATYVTGLWFESQDNSLTVDSLTRLLDVRVPEETRPLDGVDSAGDLLDGVTYQRGALLYHALRVQIGDEAFFATLREFIQRNLHDFALVEDLQQIAEELSRQDLDAFFTGWVSEPEVPLVPAADS